MLASTLRRNISETIEKHGHMVIGVEGEALPSGFRPSFAYTIGLTATYGYELLMVGLDPRQATVIMNAIAAAGTVELDVPQAPFANMPLLFKKCNMDLELLHDEFVCQADNFYGRDVDVVQIIMSDREGRTPVDRGYDHRFMDRYQPLFASFPRPELH
jgi:hypothetical protein